MLEPAASKLAPLEAAVAALQERVTELQVGFVQTMGRFSRHILCVPVSTSSRCVCASQASGEHRADDAARDLRLCKAQVRELEESAEDATVEARELRVELEQALASNAQFREALESEHVSTGSLERAGVGFRDATIGERLLS